MLNPTHLTNVIQGAESLRSQKVLSQSRNSPHFMEPEGSLPHSQQLAPYPYSEPDQSSPYLPIPVLEGQVGTARPQVVDRGTASNMDGSFEYI
jgi:hypothetical protein